VDVTIGLSYAIALTPLIFSPEKEIISFILEHIQQFTQDVAERLRGVGKTFSNTSQDYS
jgi:hypothetical protein